MKEFLKLDYKKFNDANLIKILSEFGNPHKIKILYLSTYNSDYTRTETLLSLFKKNNIDYKAILTEKLRFKYFKIISELIKNQKDYDVIFVAFRGQETLPFIKIFSKKPIIFDAFISVYDTLCFDRRKFNPNSATGKFFKWYDSYLCKISNTVLVDTKTHKDYFKREFNAKNIDYLYLGCNEKLFKPLKIKKRSSKFVVFWYGQANPLQGVDIILNAAKILEDKNIQFRIVGPVRKKYSKLINNLNLKNVEFIDYIPYNQLPLEINKSNVCLGGHFGNRNKSRRVIAGKTFQFLSCGKPTIIGDNPANREIFKESSNLRFVKMNESEDLARKILEMRR